MYCGSGCATHGGNLTIEAAGTLKLKAANIEISGDATIKVAGQTIDLN